MILCHGGSEYMIFCHGMIMTCDDMMSFNCMMVTCYDMVSCNDMMVAFWAYDSLNQYYGEFATIR